MAPCILLHLPEAHKRFMRKRRAAPKFPRNPSGGLAQPGLGGAHYPAESINFCQKQCAQAQLPRIVVVEPFQNELLTSFRRSFPTGVRGNGCWRNSTIEGRLIFPKRCSQT